MRNAGDLARYAETCQVSSLVPIVEPEILIDGNYDLHRSCVVAERVLKCTVEQLHRHQVHEMSC